MAPREKEEPTATKDSYGTMPDADDVSGYGNVVPTPLASETTTSTGNTEGKSNHCKPNCYGHHHIVPIETAIELIGTGAFQRQILLAAGLCFMADAMEVLLLSFLSTVLKHEWNLTEGEVDSIIAVVFAGALLGTLLLGRAGDVFGRKPVFAITAFVIAIAGVVTAFCQNYEQLLLARFWVGFGVGGLIVPFDTLGEFLPSAARGKNLLYIEFFWTFGTLSVPALAYLTLDTSSSAVNGSDDSHWQLFVILCSIPCFLSAFLGLILVPESPRWLLEQSHRNNIDNNDYDRTRALEILKSAARSNGISQTKIDEELFPPNTRLVLSLDEVENDHATATKTKGAKDDDSTRDEPRSNNLGSFMELFRTPDQSKLTILLWGTWFGLGFLYYGVIIAVSLVFTNEEEESSSSAYYGDDDDDGVANNNDTISPSYGFDFAAIFITASAEVFGLIVVLFTIDPIGRIPSQTMAYRIGGVFTFVLGMLCVLWIDDDGSGNANALNRSLLIGLAFVARMAMMSASCTTWVSTSEMLSTEIRSTGHGAANAMARLGGFIAPYVITEGNSMGTIGVLVLLVSFVTAECASRLPETAGKPMGDVAAKEEGVSSSTTERSSIETTTSYHKIL